MTAALSDYGLSDETVAALASSAEMDACLATNPWDATADDLAEILHDAIS